MIFVVDASVAVKWLTAEPDHERARALRAEHDDLQAPDFVLVEVGNVLWKKVRRGEVTYAQAAAALTALPRLFDKLIPAEELTMRALQKAVELDHPVYDCLYLACAESIGAQVVTADARFATVARKGGAPVVTLAEWREGKA